jgi:membrane fusion protein YbhG
MRSGSEIQFQIGVCIAGVLLVMGVLSGCVQSGPQVTGSGLIEATERIISAGIGGEILELSVKEGQRISAGDAIARLDTESIVLERAAIDAGGEEISALERQANAQIALAETALEGARKKFDRARILKKKGSISQQAYDDAETAFLLAQRQLGTARTALSVIPAKRAVLDAALRVLDHRISQGTVTAPVSGTVIETYVENGERIAPGRPIIKLADLTEVWVKMYVGEVDLGRVKLGAKAKISVDSFPDREIMGSVSWISDKSEFTPKNVQTRDARADLVYAVKITVSNPEGILKIGIPVDVRLEGFPEYSLLAADL